MVEINNIELMRLQLQAELDSRKTRYSRNKLGQFATPTALATDMLEYAKALLPGNIRFLDPAFGTGSFYSALLKTFPSSQIAEAVGYEISPDYGLQASEFWQDRPLKLKIDDFTRATPPTSEAAKFDLIIANPPYIRHHHLTNPEKQRLQNITYQTVGIKLSQLAGMYCYFLCLADAWMAENAIAGWLIPSEFMDVNYGKQIQEYLLSRVTLLHIHRFDPQDLLFADALVSSAVIWLKKTRPATDRMVKFTYGGTLKAPQVEKYIPIERLGDTAKWKKFTVPHFRSDDRSLKLSDLFTIKRGLATGANQFFILTPEQIYRHQLPEEFLKPILPSPRYLSVEEIAADMAGNPLVDRQLFWLACHLPEAEVKYKYPLLWNYLLLGVKAGYSQRYLCRHRYPWYLQENRPASRFLCTYMGRKGKKNGLTFRFILNHSRATAANVYLMLYPKPNLEKILNINRQLVKVVWQGLQEISPEILAGEGRVYGGGLHKLEPKELGNATAKNILAVLPASFGRH